MTKMRILNLYSGIGGNRKLWSDHSVLAVEIDPIIAKCYQDNFPGDEIVIDDSIRFVEENDLSRFDLIWASPPCLTHSQWNMVNGPKVPRVTDIYGLWLFFNQTRRDKPWVIENVDPWYKVLRKPSFQLGRHYYWSNYSIPKINFKEVGYYGSFRQLAEKFQLNVKRIENLGYLRKRQILRNCIPPAIGKYILENLTGENRLMKYFAQNDA